MLRSWLNLFRFDESVLANGWRFPEVSGYDANAAPDTRLFAAPAFRIGEVERRNRLSPPGDARVVFRGTALKPEFIGKNILASRGVVKT